MYYLAACYLFGRGINQDVSQAISYYWQVGSHPLVKIRIACYALCQLTGCLRDLYTAYQYGMRTSVDPKMANRAAYALSLH